MGETDVTRLLTAIDRGDGGAAEQLLPLVYTELRRLASHRLANERAGQTLQPTALVHEAYLRLTRDQAKRWANHRHFYAAAAEAMRRILIDQARRKARIKHGGGRQKLDVDELDPAEPQEPQELIDLDAALEKLAEQDPVKAELVKLRYFAGLELTQVAQVLGISRATASRYWTYARAWLFDEINA